MSAPFWTTALFWVAVFVPLIAAMVISTSKPERLRYRELPVWLWASLGGRDARARLRFILASRERAAREAIGGQIDRDIEAGRLASMDSGLGAFGTLTELRRSRKLQEMTAAGSAWSAGLAAALKPPAIPSLLRGLPGHEVLWSEERGHVCVSLPYRVAGPLEEHEVVWVEGHGRVCLTCEESEHE